MPISELENFNLKKFYTLKYKKIFELGRKTFYPGMKITQDGSLSAAPNLGWRLLSHHVFNGGAWKI